MSSQSSAVYKHTPQPLCPAFSPHGRVQLCVDYALLMEISRNVALISILCLPMHLLLVLTTRDLDFPVLLTSLKRPDLSFKDWFKTVNLQCTNLHLWYSGHSALSLPGCKENHFYSWVFTSPDVISTSPKSFSSSRIDFTLLLLFEFLKEHHLPVGQVKNRFH